MSNQEIPKVYEPKNVEDSIYKKWEESGFFNPDNLPGHRPKAFSIAMPPPNATGVLHIGHAEFITIQDLVIRYQRMLGKKTLWLPGTDHAAIATQTKVEKLIKAKDGKSRHDLGREEFLKRVKTFVVESQNTIRNQIRKMGSSCDWSRERYTLDSGLTKAVNEAFVRMHKDGLIYRGNRIVNWCPRCQSTLADDEVEYREQKAPFYYFKYGPVVIGTARPETKFGDKVIIVHPDDKRYKDLVGQELPVEWILGPITAKVIADPVAEMDLGSGAMTITPGHSFVDFELAQKYHLPIEKIINEKGELTQVAGSFAGLDVATARHKVFELLKSKGLVDHVDENYVHNLSVCYRCDTPVEPLVSEQWFIAVNKPIKKFGGKSLKERALAVVKDSQVEIVPERFKKVYYHWLENLRDWCISRQIWFGHRIPVYYRKRENPKSSAKGGSASGGKTQNSKLDKSLTEDEVYVGSTPPAGEGWQQDPDTLDTWFSSGLWTFSTLGWPEKTKDLKTFHPTSLMETGYDILFFWVARMIIMSTYLMDQVPFQQVYLHGLVRDEQGRKMSKSLDNIIDPLEVIKKFGADAVRLSLLIGVTPGNDLNLAESKIAGARNFINKLWNISRYILMTTKKPELIETRPKPKTLADQWILDELTVLQSTVTTHLDAYQFSMAGEAIYEFSWSKFADWYLEIAKIEGGKDDILLYVLQNLLKLWHPFTPFVTERIWAMIDPNGKPKALLMVESWPQVSRQVSSRETKVVKDFNLVQQVVSTIRNLRAESNIAPGKLLTAIIVAGPKVKIIKDQSEVIKSLARLGELEVLVKGKKPAGSLSALAAGLEIYLPVSDMIDIGKEVSRLNLEVKRVKDFIIHLENKLQNQKFLERAPKNIIANEQKKLEENKENLGKIQQQLKSLK
ncbi:MAG: valine--tRNA ligase [Candidatus Buchananbacteria bacterium RIFCSPLOWO2_01_FULL_46_12]|uniref:Valine--tRNA ligase n=2 Tax=Candidatus Buchananiibacteriota TaxID=1817903 RepID=A0A1G1YVQ0_9BACT|nr:MAG: valine--tRNA ligase [Candidatus Buchananbacteria bacterium RIFCSPHIGHO2_01_FULL_44_11]OGY55477.1 MAG: valine--tRNA ligase [Candidatus Buchananbacteria bacterium RIFCSPLOWO2_01_FULL_46_12]